MDNQVEVLMAIDVDDDGNAVMKDAFLIDRNDLERVLNERIGGFEDAATFLSEYDPETDGVEVFEAVKDMGIPFDRSKYCLSEDGEDEDDDLDLDGFDSLEDIDETDMEGIADSLDIK